MTFISSSLSHHDLPIVDLRIERGRSLILAGASGAGKTQFILSVLESPERYLERVPTRVVWCSKTLKQQPDIVERLEKRYGALAVETYDHFPEDVDAERGSFWIVDDLAVDVQKSQRFTEFFSATCHHRDCNLAYLTQFLFQKGGQNRAQSINAHYMVLFRNPRDKLSIQSLFRQAFPGKSSSSMAIFTEATREPYSSLMIDFRQNTPDHARFIGHFTSIEPSTTGYPVYYVPSSGTEFGKGASIKTQGFKQYYTLPELEVKQLLEFIEAEKNKLTINREQAEDVGDSGGSSRYLFWNLPGFKHGMLRSNDGSRSGSIDANVEDFTLYPKNVRGKIRHLAAILPAKWTNKLELLYNGAPLPGSNKIDLLKYFTEVKHSNFTTKHPPIGAPEMYEIIRKNNIPNSLLGHALLNDKGVKRKLTNTVTSGEVLHGKRSKKMINKSDVKAGTNSSPAQGYRQLLKSKAGKSDFGVLVKHLPNTYINQERKFAKELLLSNGKRLGDTWMGQQLTKFVEKRLAQKNMPTVLQYLVRRKT